MSAIINYALMVLVIVFSLEFRLLVLSDPFYLIRSLPLLQRAPAHKKA